MIGLIILVFAFVLLFLEALKIGHPRISFGWLGLALWVLTIIIPALHR